MKPALLSADELTRRLTAAFPQMFVRDGFSIEDVHHGGCHVRRGFHEDTLRPGGTVSGPTLMELADFAMYVALLASIGWQPLAVTTNLTMNFLRKPPPRDLIAECALLKVGKRLAVGAVTIRSDGEEDAVAHATATYSIP
jgi:uncharacterized protein (TIGR00369 family)